MTEETQATDFNQLTGHEHTESFNSPPIETDPEVEPAQVNELESRSENLPSFEDILEPRMSWLSEKLENIGISQPTEVQHQAVPLALKGQDLLVEAETGSGKTMTFVLPLLAHLKQGVSRSSTVALVVTPTRELAQQVASVIESLAPESSDSPVVVVGGVNQKYQVRDLRRNPGLVVGTPGRILDLMRQRQIDLRSCSFFALDEADEMLSMGFLEDVQAILRHLPTHRQGIMVSATISPRVELLASHVLNRPEVLAIEKKERESEESKVEHLFVSVGSGLMDKGRMLVRLIEHYHPRSAIVFCNTKSDTELVEAILKRQGFDAEKLNSDLHQKQREAVMDKLRGDRLNLLIATDLAARGIDIEQIDLVVNYTLPEQAESYVHRTGRTGRAGRAGRAISLIAPLDIPKLHILKKSIGAIFDELEDSFDH